MDKREPSPTDSSILLKSVNLFTPHTSDNVLMPVGAQNLIGNPVTTVACSETPNPTNASDSKFSSSLCQLEQPLLFGGISRSTNTSDSFKIAQMDTPSAVSHTESFHNIDFQSASYSTQASVPSYNPVESAFYSSLSNPSISSVAYKTHSEPPRDSSPADFKTVVDKLAQSAVYKSTDQSNYRRKSYSDSNTLVSVPLQHQQQSSFNTVNVLKPYWLFQDTVEAREIWYGFSEIDSEKLERTFQQGHEFVVPTDGGRYDVYLQTRTKKSVYFEYKELHVRRCTWFYQEGSSVRFKPYDENTAGILEDYYNNWVASRAPESRFTIPGIIGNFVFEIPHVMLHYGIDSNTWTVSNDPKGSPKVIKRGLPGCFQIMPNESPQIDHLLFIVQGIGQFCDLRFRTVSECVDGLRDISNKLIESHFKNEVAQGFVGRVEILPVAWHAKLHTSDIGLDRTMKMITLPSIPKLRHFTNDTLIDILLYSSPSYCQSIINTVAEEINHIYEIFIQRNPTFAGKVFVAGHSLGSLILFDILSNQNISDCDTRKSSFDNSRKSSVDSTTPQNEFKHVFEKFANIEELLKTLELDEFIDTFNNQKIDLLALPYLSEEDLINIGLPLGPRRKLMNLISSEKEMTAMLSQLSEPVSTGDGKEETLPNVPEKTNGSNRMIYPLHKPNAGLSSIVYPKLLFHPAAFFALGSPISMFLAIRGFDSISEQFHFPTCSRFFHIFHPYDPVVFRIEPLIDHNFKEKPVLIPHHKGRKRMHLEIKENVAKFASEFRQKVMDTLHRTWNSFNEFTGFQPIPVMEHEVDSMVSQQISEMTTYEDHSSYDVFVGNLNGGRRIDYVLQEKPLEAINDYVWALTSHATYWDSEDTVLMILREIYAIQGINVSPMSETDTFLSESSSVNVSAAKEYSPLSQDFQEKTIYSEYPPSVNKPYDAPPLSGFIYGGDSSVNFGGPVPGPGTLTSGVSFPISEPSFPIQETFNTGSSQPIPDSFASSLSGQNSFVSSGSSLSGLDSFVSSGGSFPAPGQFVSSGGSLSGPGPLISSGSSVHGIGPHVSAGSSLPGMGPLVGSGTSLPGPGLLVNPGSSLSTTGTAASSGVSAPMPSAPNVGPPPLSGFVKRSAFTK